MGKKHNKLSGPFVLGLAGPAGSGKTVVASALAPTAQVIQAEAEFWTKLSFALPIQRMVTARQKIAGTNLFSRQCFEIHNTLADLFRGSLSYDELVDLTYEIVNLPCDLEGKPRSFMQYVGTELCRGIDADVWVKWMSRKILEEHLHFDAEQRRSAESDPDYIWKDFCVVIDDVRFPNECFFVTTVTNSALVRFDVSSSVAAERIAARDGVALSPSQAGHASESGLQGVPEDLYDATIDTNDLTVKDQVKATKKIIQLKRFGSIYGSLQK